MAKIQPGKNATKKDVIIQKAAGLFRTKGFSAASMRELADAVGVEAPSLYNHIGSKKELLQAICFTIAKKFTDHLADVEKGLDPIVDKLENIIRFHIRMMLDEFDAVFVANHEWKHLENTQLNNFLTLRRNYEKKLAELIESGIQRKELKETDPYVAVLTILSALRGLEFWHRNKKNIPPEKLAHEMVKHLLTGIVN